VQVHLTEQARLELIEIGEWIERDSAVSAAAFVEELYQACMSLGPMPRAFPLVPDKPSRKIRKRVYGDYLIFYTVKSRVNVLHILHGARDYRPILFAS